MRVWDVYPAIDLRGGRVVRLRQGDPGRETAYADDPVAVARRWAALGASWLHVVNLDGAFGDESAANLVALERIVAVGVRVQFGGGLRDLSGLRHVVGLGVERAVIGTAAVEDPGLVESALDAFGPARIAVGIDARAGTVRTRGWRQDASVTPEALGRTWSEKGVRWAIYTDVARDGMGSGLNIQATARLAEATGLNVIASGGVRSIADAIGAYEAGLSGIIIGRALYEGHVDLAAALAVGEHGGAEQGETAQTAKGDQRCREAAALDRGEGQEGRRPC